MNSTIVSNKRIGPSYFRMEVQIDTFDCECIPGQFMMIRISSKSYDPLLRRPLSIMSSSRNGRMEFIYKIVGRGTQILSELQPDAPLDLLGPLGNGFTVDSQVNTAILVGGGVGVPPVFFLATVLSDRKNINPHVFIGAKTKADLILWDEIRSLPVKSYATTEDGSYGDKGMITSPLQSFLQSTGKEASTIYACGPYAMLRSITDLARQYNLPCQISLEAHMGCGIGACLGCVVQTNLGQRRVCIDGPVFDSGSLEYWD